MSVLDNFLNACRTHNGNESDPVLRQAKANFLDAVAADQSIAIQAAAALPDLGPDAAAWLAVISGHF